MIGKNYHSIVLKATIKKSMIFLHKLLLLLKYLQTKKKDSPTLSKKEETNQLMVICTYLKHTNLLMLVQMLHPKPKPYKFVSYSQHNLAL